MTYTELEVLVDNEWMAGNYENVIQLITEENVRTVIECNQRIPLFGQLQTLTRPDETLQAYLELYTAVETAPSSSWVMQNAFTVYNVLLAAFGSEYETAVDVAEQQFADDGWPSPTMKAVTDTQAEYVRRADLQNPQPSAPC